jgi:hypothetical protein
MWGAVLRKLGCYAQFHPFRFTVIASFPLYGVVAWGKRLTRIEIAYNLFAD